MDSILKNWEGDVREVVGGLVGRVCESSTQAACELHGIRVSIN
jgi:hypothetical protein